MTQEPPYSFLPKKLSRTDMLRRAVVVVDVDAPDDREMPDRAAAEEKAEMLVGAERADARRRIDCIVMMNDCIAIEVVGAGLVLCFIMAGAVVE